jgi:cytochrome c553
MRSLGAWFEQQKPKGLAAHNAATVKMAQKLYRGGDADAEVPACAACHGPDGAGVPKNYPRLGGQHADYIYTQLRAFKTGDRGGDEAGKDPNGAIMVSIAARLTDAQMKALADYVQGLR